ncbi:MAG: energy-coupling factor transporter ATPase [Anaerolineae bacterium]
MLIRVDHLVHTYAPRTPMARTALAGVDLEIGPGERLGILGRTGSGKSTLVQHLAGLLEPTAGCVWLDGTAAHERSAAARTQRRRIGLAFQYPEDQIFEQTVFREVAFGPRNLQLSEGKIAQRVDWALEMVGLDPAAVRDRNPFTLSGGEMRRVALAAILATEPEVLILDEPTAGLDPRGRRELLQRIQASHAAIGSTLILVSHDLDEVARMVERVVLLDAGTVAADGPAEKVLSDARRLRAVGLDTPRPVALLHKLNAAGWPVRTNCLLPATAVEEIARVWRGREGGR